MKVSLCTACQAGLVIGMQACNQCAGRALDVNEAVAAEKQSAWRKWLSAIGSFFESQASLSLVTLLIFLGLGIALAPVGWNYSHGEPPARTPAGSPAKCSGLTVFFAEMATVGELKDLLEQLRLAIVSGPTESGAFELAAPEGALPALVRSLGEAESTVEGVFIKPCRLL